MTAIEQSMRLMAQKICGIDARKLDILNAEKQEIFLKAPDNKLIINWIKIVNIRRLGSFLNYIELTLIIQSEAII